MRHFDNFAALSRIIAPQGLELLSERFRDKQIEQNSQSRKCFVIGFGNDQIIALKLKGHEIYAEDRGRGAHTDPNVRKSGFYPRRDFEMGRCFSVKTVNAPGRYTRRLKLSVEQPPRARAFFSIDKFDG